VRRLGRREFLEAVVVSAAVPSCAPDDEPAAPVSDEEILRTYPQGVASGDPRPDSVVLWVRVAPPDDDPEAAIEVSWELARDEALQEIVVAGSARLGPETDHTLRLRITDLEPWTRYWYRFAAGGVPSPIGRTKTAPAPDQDVPVRIAVASCQEYVGRWYHAWRLLADEADEIDFVLFLGDYIYESIADPRFQPSGSERSLTLPDGMSLDGSPENLVAATLSDYRALYRQYRADPDLRRIHQLLPFVIIWDDHEFTNDCWQDVANEFDGRRGLERSTERREAATRAWVEYLPLDVVHDPASGFPKDVVAYRSLRFGAHAELFLSDVRYYRDDHLVPEDEAEPAVGKLAPNSPLGSRVLALKDGFDELEAMARPTMLGDAQRDWLVSGIATSPATWKLWASPLMVAQMVLDLTEREEAPAIFRNRFYFKVDQWDGFRSERAAILGDLAAVPGVAVLSGDLHGSYAAVLREDFDAPESAATAVELTVPGVSSISLQEQLDLFAATDPRLASTGLADVTYLFDEVLLEAGPHFVHANSRAYGYVIVDVTATELLATFVELSAVTSPDPPPPPQRIAFRIRGTALERV
jgi:alkaline phosphatase D